MILLPYVGIDQRVSAILKSLIKEETRYGADPDYHATHVRRHARTLEILLSQSLGTRMLEVGTSSIIPMALSTLSPGVSIDVTHFDLSMPSEGKMPINFGSKQLNLRYMAVDLESTPLPTKDDTYDSILCSEVLEHLDVDPMYMLAELNRVLKLGGTLVLSTPNSCSTQSLWKLLRGYEPYFYMQYHKDRSPYRHNYEYSKRTLKTVLEAAGFEVDVWTENTFEDPVMEDLERLKLAGYDLDPAEMGDNLFVVAKKISGIVDRHPSVLYV